MIKNNKSGSYREYNSNMYGLKESQFNELMSSNPKFGDAKNNYQTLELSKGELLNEIKIHNNIWAPYFMPLQIVFKCFNINV